MDQEKHPSQKSDQDHCIYEKTYVAGSGFNRYNNSLKNLIPIRRERKDDGTMSVDRAGLLSVVSFSWLSKLMYRAHRKRLTLEELPSVSPYDACNYNVERLELIWKEELTKNGTEAASFSRAAWKFCRTRVFAASILFACSIGFGSLSSTVFMRKLLGHVESGNQNYAEGVKWALFLSIAELMRTFLFTWACALSYRTALRLRSACMTLVYRKIIRLNNLGTKSIGEVINMFSNDAQKIFDMIYNGPFIVGGPILTVVAIFYILWLFSPMALLGITAFFVFYPVQCMVTRLSEYLQSKAVKTADTRIRLMNEILNCIKMIKMYAWENRFSQNLLETRKKEQRMILKILYCQSFSVSMAPTIPIISVIITFIAHVYAGNNLTAAQVFPYVTLLDSRFGFSLTLFQWRIEGLVSARISFDRIKGLLLLENCDYSIKTPILESHAVVINNGTFGYSTFSNQKQESSHQNEKNRSNARKCSEEEKEKAIRKPHTAALITKDVNILFDVSFEATKGKLVGICGHVGSGKSSLLLAAMGQLRVSKGQVMSDGSCAYVSQEAWITNATLRENILFGESFNHARYYKAIDACNLSQDISTMPGGDQTEIGEKGINLSGGQKQRVALARAL